MNCLVIGGDGMLGSALVKYLKTRHAVCATSRHDPADRSYFDLMDPLLPKLLYNINATSPFGVVYIVAALAKVWEAEVNPDAWLVNAEAPALIALHAVQRRIFPVFVSSDAVERRPTLAYAQQKMYAEIMVRMAGGAVVRPTRIPKWEVDSLCQLLEQAGMAGVSRLYRWSPKVRAIKDRENSELPTFNFNYDQDVQEEQVTSESTVHGAGSDATFVPVTSGVPGVQASQIEQWLRDLGAESGNTEWHPYYKSGWNNALTTVLTKLDEWKKGEDGKR